ncbi:MAG: TRAP transporter substrate-binding protein [Phycisphaerae bacterium]
MSKSVTTLTAVLLMAASITMLCSCSDEDDATYTLQYNVFFPATHVQAELAQQWADEIREKTDGDVDITVGFTGKYAKANQTYEAVSTGEVDIGMSCFAYTRGRFPLLEGLDLPVGYPDGKTASKTAHELVKKYNPKEVQDTHVLYVHAHGPGILATRKEVRSLEDVEGLKIRATGLSSKIVDKLGGTPVAKSQSETAELLSKNVVDATLCPAETLEGWKQAEEINYVVDSRCIGYTTSMFVVMNKDVWESLPVEYQKTITEVSEKYAAKAGQAWDEADESARKLIAELEKETVELSPQEQEKWEARVAPILDEYAQRDKEGLPCRTFLADIQTIVKEAEQQQ